MSIVPQILHQFNSENTFIGVQLDGDVVVIGKTRNEEHAAEGRFLNLVTVIPLAEAVAIAKALLATQQADEDARYDAWVEAQYQRYLDYEALVDAALEHEISF